MVNTKYVLVPVEPTEEMRIAWNTTENNSESYFSVSAYKSAIAAAPNPPAPKVIAHRVLQTDAGYPMTDWIDGETDAEPAFSNCIYQLAYDHPSPAEADKEAVPSWFDVRNSIAIFLSGATGRSSENWMQPLEDLAVGTGTFAKLKKALYRKSQPAQLSGISGELPATIDKEAVRNAALEEVSVLLDDCNDFQGYEHSASYFIRALKSQPAPAIHPDTTAPKLITAGTMVELKDKIYTHHGWKRLKGESMSGRVGETYDITADMRGGKFIAKPKSQPAKPSDTENDSAKYRWLRDRNDWHAEPRLDEEDGTVWKLTFYTPAPIIDPTDDDSLDVAIKEAMRAEREGS